MSTLTWVVFVSLALVAVGCSAATPVAAPSRVGSGSATDVPSTGAPSPSGVPEILDFEAPLLGGGTFEGAGLAGEAVAMWFWAPW